MTKYLNIILLVLITNIAFSQTYKKYLPYKHQGLWGIIDTTQNIIVEPQYKKVKILGNFDYVEFDGKYLFDINNGVTLKSDGNIVNRVTIDNNNYYLFNIDTKSVLIDLVRKDTISLSLKYEKMINISLIHPLTGDKNDYIIGKLASGKHVLLKNNKQLPLAIRKRFNDFDFAYNKKYNQHNIFIIKSGNQSYAYNNTLKLVTAFVNADDYEILSVKQLSKLARMFKVDKLSLRCYTCDEIEMGYWNFNEDPILPKVFNVEYRNNRLSVTYKSSSGEEIEIDPTLLYGNSIIPDIETISFDNNEIIVDYKYVKSGVLMFPETVLKN